MDRIATLKSFIERNSDDPFPRYGLAMEYRNTGQLDEAQAIFDELTERFPDYLAAYLMAGNNLADLGRKEDAAAMYRNGIEVSRRLGDAHTTSELETALAEL
ncbi:MAG: tetratricopeptide repeat protein [Proteobacteria bacterium]|nr:tetratricopeptide repeat protein [Pseudomonadota bacterium]